MGETPEKKGSRIPTENDWAIVDIVRSHARSLVLLLNHEALILEALVLYVAREEHLSNADTAFITALVLGNATQENWQSHYIPF
jgi:hypothetical protein